MRIYKSCLEALKEVERDLAEMGIEYQSYSVQDKVVVDNDNYRTKEITHYGYTITDPLVELYEMVRYKKEKRYADWVQTEALERTSKHPVSNSRNPGDAWQLYPDLWKEFIHDGHFSYTYMERWREQLPYVIDELERHPTSRQVMITMYDRHQDMMHWGGSMRVPCSMTYNFLIREGKLIMCYTQRSCDFYQFFQADMFCSIWLMKHVVEELNRRGVAVHVGKFTHFISSLHAFKKDLKEIF